MISNPSQKHAHFPTQFSMPTLMLIALHTVFLNVVKWNWTWHICKCISVYVTAYFSLFLLSHLLILVGCRISLRVALRTVMRSVVKLAGIWWGRTTAVLAASAVAHLLIRTPVFGSARTVARNGWREPPLQDAVFANANASGFFFFGVFIEGWKITRHSGSVVDVSFIAYRCPSNWSVSIFKLAEVAKQWPYILWP